MSRGLSCGLEMLAPQLEADLVASGRECAVSYPPDMGNSQETQLLKSSLRTENEFWASPVLVVPGEFTCQCRGTQARSLLQEDPTAAEQHQLLSTGSRVCPCFPTRDATSVKSLCSNQTSAAKNTTHENKPDCMTSWQ